MTDFPTYTTGNILNEDMTAKSSLLNENFDYTPEQELLVDETQDEIQTSDIITEPPRQGFQEITKYFSFSHDLIFSATDSDTVAWASGTLKLNNGQTFAIAAGNTGNISALTYIYFDIRTSKVALQTTTSFRTSCGDGKITIAVAKNNAAAGKDATFQVFGGTGGSGIFITADNIAANTITANELSVTQLSAISADLGTITAGDITGITITGSTVRSATSGARVEMTSTGILAVYNASQSVIYMDSGNASYYFSGYASGSVQAMRLFAANASTSANILEIDANNTSGNALYINGTSYTGTNIFKADNLASTTILFQGTSTSGQNIFRVNQLDLDKTGVLITNSTSASGGNAAIVEMNEYTSGLPPLKCKGVSSTCLILDGDSNSIAHIKLLNITSGPGTPVEGDFWYDSSAHVLKYHNGTAVKTVATV